MKSYEEMMRDYGQTSANNIVQKQKLGGDVGFQAQVQTNYERALGTKVNMNPNDYGNFQANLLRELQQKEQLRDLLGGVEPGMLGIEELVLLMIWTKPLVSSPATAH